MPTPALAPFGKSFVTTLLRGRTWPVLAVIAAATLAAKKMVPILKGPAEDLGAQPSPAAELQRIADVKDPPDTPAAQDVADAVDPLPVGEGSALDLDLDRINGIDSPTQTTLAGIGITTIATLLERSGTRLGRVKIAEQTDISNEQILRWVQQADLLRLPGMTGDYGGLLKAGGVDTVAELARRNPDNLAAKLVRVKLGRDADAEGDEAGDAPSGPQVAAWV